MLRLWGILLASAALAGCAYGLSQPQPKMVWLRLDGQRGAENPVLARQFETDRSTCLGTTQQSNEPSQAIDTIAKDCMAAKGYISSARRSSRNENPGTGRCQRPKTFANIVFTQNSWPLGRYLTINGRARVPQTKEAADRDGLCSRSDVWSLT